MVAIKTVLVVLSGFGSFYLSRLLPGGSDKYGLRLVGGVDPQPERSPHLADLHAAQIPLYSDLKSFYAEHSADLAILSTQIQTHYPLSQLAVEHGTHVLCEKPLCGSWEDAQAFQRPQASTDVQIAIGYQSSFSAAIQSLKQDLMPEAFGPVISAKAIAGWPPSLAYFSRNGWAGRRTIAGQDVMDSPVNNATAHFLHNLLYLLGSSKATSARPVDISAQLYRATSIENFDTALIQLRTATGIPLHFATAHPVQEGVAPTFSIRCEHAVIAMAQDEVVARTVAGKELKHYGVPEEGEEAKFHHAAEMCRTGEAPCCGVDTACSQTAVIDELSKIPIQDFAASSVDEESLADGSRVRFVLGLHETLLRAYETSTMPTTLDP